MRLRRRRYDSIAEAIVRARQTAVAVEDVTRPNGVVTVKRHYADGTHDYAFVDPWVPTGISADSPFPTDPRRRNRGGTMIRRDDRGQLASNWTERDYDLLAILEEVASPNMNPDKTLAAYMADIHELFATADG